MSLMSSSLKDSIGSRDQIIGVLLSQEGIELVRNLRDNNWANSRDTFDSSNFPVNDDMDCSITLTSAIQTTPIYTISGMPNKFQRKIQVDYDDNTIKNTAEITSVVIWGGSGSNFPTNPITQTNCNTATKCAYTSTTLTRWGGM